MEGNERKRADDLPAGAVYGNVIEAEKPIEFYFEAQERKECHDENRMCSKIQ